jgi:hypothetical protein
MPPTIFDADRRAALIARLDRLRPDATPRWGRFDAARMIAHLTEAFRMAAGELQAPRKLMPFRPLVRWLMLYMLPFPKGAPTAPALLARRPTDWDADLARLRGVIDAVRAPTPDASTPEHPIFGAMRARDWGVLMYKHVDHHLRQFGV